MRKLKIKRKPADWKPEGGLIEVGGEVQMAKIKIPSLSKKAESKKEKKKGKIIIRKKKGKLDRGTAEDITESGLSVGMEKSRLKSEREMYKKFLKGMK